MNSFYGLRQSVTMEVLSGWYSPGLGTLRNDPAVRRRMSVVYELLRIFCAGIVRYHWRRASEFLGGN